MPYSPLKPFLVCLFGQSLLAGPLLAEPVQHLAILLDLSERSPLRHPDFEQAIGPAVIREITGLELGLGDRLSLRTIGASAPAVHLAHATDDIFRYRRAEPRALPGFLTARFREMAANAPHPEADLIGALGRISDAVDCTGNVALQVIVIANVIDQGRVEGGSYHYPALPQGMALFPGCQTSLSFHGFALNPEPYDTYTIQAARAVIGEMLSAGGIADVEFR